MPEVSSLLPWRDGSPMGRWLGTVSMASLLSPGPDLVVSRSRRLSGVFSNQVGDISPGTWAKTIWVHKARHCPMEHLSSSSQALSHRGRLHGGNREGWKIPWTCQQFVAYGKGNKELCVWLTDAKRLLFPA